MSKVTIELDEYNELRDGFQAKKREAEEKQKQIDRLQEELVSKVTELQEQGKVAVIIKERNPFSFFGDDAKIVEVHNLVEVEQEVKTYIEKEQKMSSLKEEFDKLATKVVEPMENLTEENKRLKETINNIKALSWWKRLFNKF